MFLNFFPVAFFFITINYSKNISSLLLFTINNKTRGKNSPTKIEKAQIDLI